MDKQEIIGLVCAIQNGENGAATALCDAFEKELYEYILKIVNDSILAKGLLQETFAEIFESINELKEPAEFPTWSKEIAYRNCIEYLKRHKVILDGESKSFIGDTIKGKITEQLIDESLQNNEAEHTVGDIVDRISLDEGTADVTSVADVATESGDSVVSEIVKQGVKTTGKSALKKLIAGITAGVVVSGGIVTAALLNNDKELPMEWVGYGIVSNVFTRRFELNVDEMDDSSISGHLEVSYLYETVHDTDFTGIGTVSDGDIIYELTFENPAVVGTIPTFEYDQLELKYDKETDEFSFCDIYDVDMERVETDLEILAENTKWSGEGEDGFYIASNKTGHFFEINVDKMTEAEISGNFSLSYNGTTDHDSKFVGQGYRKNDIVYYEIKLETPRTVDNIFEITVGSFWLHYDTKSETFTIPSSEIYSVVMKKT